MLGLKHAEWLEKRGISPTVAERMGLYTVRPESSGQYTPDPDGKILAMPFIRGGEEVGCKYRGPQKKFWQRSGGRKQFWNADILDDPALHDGSQSLVIVEGEMDALAVATAGHPWVVSVPDGAPPARDGEGRLIDVPKGTEDIDIDSDTKFSFLLSDWDSLSSIRKIIIATDADEPGRRLANELVRRLDRVRCFFVTFPEGAKDMNDVLEKLGIEGVKELIDGAKPYPVDGLYKMADFPPETTLQTYSTGWGSMDGLVNPYLSAFMVVGGFPGHGKSTWCLQLAANMAMQHGWNVAVASFEMQIVPYVTNTLMSSFIRGNIKFTNPAARAKAEGWVNNRFTFIAPQSSDTETDHDIDWLIDKMAVAVIREGVRMVLIDPFNEIEHRKRNDETQTEYIGRAIRKLKAFAHQYDVLVCVVVHPTKAASQVDSADLSLYNLADSSHWANKADIGVIVGRVGDPRVDLITGIYVKKIRYQPDAGKLGEAFLTFDPETRLFY